MGKLGNEIGGRWSDNNKIVTAKGNMRHAVFGSVIKKTLPNPAAGDGLE